SSRTQLTATRSPVSSSTTVSPGWAGMSSRFTYAIGSLRVQVIRGRARSTTTTAAADATTAAARPAGGREGHLQRSHGHAAVHVRRSHRGVGHAQGPGAAFQTRVVEVKE